MAQDRDLFTNFAKIIKNHKTYVILPLNLSVFLYISNNFKNSEKVSILVQTVLLELDEDIGILLELDEDVGILLDEEYY